MEAGPPQSLEQALARTEGDAEGAVVVAKRLANTLTAARRAAAVGDLRALGRALETAEEVLADVAEAVGQLSEGWSLSEEQQTELLSSGAYVRELMEAARAADLQIYEQDGVISSYPSLVRVLPRQGAVSIDRKQVRQIRPSHLVEQLRARQQREPALRSERFIETLYDAYRLLAEEPGTMVRLSDVYEALTLLPAAAREYSRQEFARDIYLLDRSGHTTTKSGARLRLSSGATSARNRRNLLVVVTREGVEKSYFGIEFAEDGT